MLNSKNNTETIKSDDDSIDFDAWMDLYKSDPEAFEHQREAMIQQTISKAPEQHQRRLNGLQFQIDMERRRAETPLQSCMKISSMMWEKFDHMRAQLNEFKEQQSGTEKPAVKTTESPVKATVLEFAPR